MQHTTTPTEHASHSHSYTASQSHGIPAALSRPCIVTVSTHHHHTDRPNCCWASHHTAGVHGHAHAERIYSNTLAITKNASAPITKTCLYHMPAPITEARLHLSRNTSASPTRDFNSPRYGVALSLSFYLPSLSFFLSFFCPLLSLSHTHDTHSRKERAIHTHMHTHSCTPSTSV